VLALFSFERELSRSFWNDLLLPLYPVLRLWKLNDPVLVRFSVFVKSYSSVILDEHFDADSFSTFARFRQVFFFPFFGVAFLFFLVDPFGIWSFWLFS